VKIIVISGSMGAGKTAVMGEASDVLLSRSINHAAIDLDIVATPLLPERLSHDVYLKNIAALFNNCRSAGIDRSVVAAAIEHRTQLEEFRTASQATAIIVCRLTAAHETMAARLRTREPGARQEEFVERSRTLDAIVAAAGVEDFSIVNDGRDITAVATELLQRARWI
jgi:ribose 1,5-bisphosphokinase PhnN